VAVCPTGIDIRNGTQMECVNCTACIDACDQVMTKTGRPEGLIRYASLNSIEGRSKLKFTSRMGWYLAVVSILAGVLAVLIFSRTDVEAIFLRAPGGLFQKTAEGKISNLYTLKLINKTTRELPVELRLENIAGSLKVMGDAHLIVPKADFAQTSVLIELAPETLKGPSTRFKLGVYQGEKRVQTVDSVFIGPRN
jgi:polyferredoxin